MKKIILSALCLIVSITLTAQDNGKENNKQAVGLSIGTEFGIDYSYKLNEKVSLTARYNFLNYSQDDIKEKIDGKSLVFDGSLDIQNFDVVASYYPFGTSFKVVGGFGYFIKSDIEIEATFEESVFIGDVEFTSNDVGVITIKNNWNKIAPYLGVGFGRAVPNKRFGFGVELGTYFAGSPDVEVSATGIVEQTSSQQPLVQEAFDDYKFLPYVSFRLSYSL